LEIILLCNAINSKLYFCEPVPTFFVYKLYVFNISFLYTEAPVTSRLNPTVILDCPTMGGNLDFCPHTCTHSHLVYTYLWVVRARTHVKLYINEIQLNWNTFAWILNLLYSLDRYYKGMDILNCTVQTVINRQYYCTTVFIFLWETHFSLASDMKNSYFAVILILLC